MSADLRNQLMSALSLTLLPERGCFEWLCDCSPASCLGRQHCGRHLYRYGNAAAPSEIDAPNGTPSPALYWQTLNAHQHLKRLADKAKKRPRNSGHEHSPDGRAPRRPPSKNEHDGKNISVCAISQSTRPPATRRSVMPLLPIQPRAVDHWFEQATRIKLAAERYSSAGRKSGRPQ